MSANLQIKKDHILRLIMSVNDEATLDEIGAKIVNILPEINEAEQYINNIQIEEDIDVEKLAREQNYKGIDLEEMKRLTAELDIPQTTEELLAMLD